MSPWSGTETREEPEFSWRADNCKRTEFLGTCVDHGLLFMSIVKAWMVNCSQGTAGPWLVGVEDVPGVTIIIDFGRGAMSGPRVCFVPDNCKMVDKRTLDQNLNECNGTGITLRIVTRA